MFCAGRGTKLARFVSEAVSKDIAGERRLVREAFDGVDVAMFGCEGGPKVGGALMAAMAGGLRPRVVPAFSNFCCQNQTPAARAKAARKIRGNRQFRLRIARYLV